MNAPGRAQRAAVPLLLLTFTFIGAGLRLHAIGQKGLWLDEAFSVWLGSHRLPEMWGWIVRIDQHPPLYYTLLNFWMRLGDGAATVRLLSTVAGALTIPVSYLLARQLAGPLTGLLTALLLAVSPFHVRFAQEARMYTLLALTASVAMLCLAYLLSESPAVTLSGLVNDPPPRQATSEEPLFPGRRDSWFSLLRVGALGARSLRMTLRNGTLRNGLAWVGYVVFTAAAMLTHSAALLLPVATNLFVFGLTWWRRTAPPTPSRTGVRFPAPGQSWGLHPPPLRSWLAAQAGVLLLWGAIWLPVFIRQAGGVYLEFWLPAPIWRTVVDFLGNSLSAHLPRLLMPWMDLIWFIYAALLVTGIAALRKRSAVPALLLTLFLTPLVGELLISLRRPVFYDRTLIWATIPLYVLVAAGIAALRRWLFVMAAAAILVAANGVSLREYYVNFQKEGWREAAAYVSQQAREGDLILFNASWVQIPFDYYFAATDRPVAEHGLPADLFERGILEPKMTLEDLPRLHELIREHPRVWLVYGHNWYTDPDGLISAALAQTLLQTERRSYEGLDLRLYEDVDEK